MQNHIKNTIRNIGIGLLTGFLTYSCTDLDEHVYDQMLTSDFYKSDKDIALAMSPVYADLRLLFDWQRWWDLQESADICVTPQRPSGWFDGGVYQRLHYHTWNADDVHINWFWDNAYAGINDCNRVIFQVETSPNEIANSETILAEVKTVRAFWYYLLCDSYGNVPLSLSFDIPADSLLPTEPRTKVLQFVINEIKSNLQYLSNETNTATYGRMNQYAASFLLAKAYLNSEAWVGVAKYDSCNMYCSTILNSEEYDISSSYESIFAEENESSKEAIFNLPMDELIDGAIIYMAYRKTLHADETKIYKFISYLDNGVVATPSFIDSFDPLDQRLEWNFLRGQRLMPNGDTVFSSASKKPLFYSKDFPSVEDGGEFGGYRLNKYELYEGANIETNNDWVWFRLAEVNFMKAECLLRTGGDADSAALLVNEVRKRAFKTADWSGKAYTAADLTATIEVNGVATPYGQLLKEYGWEFCYEGQRREQLIRFGNFVTGTWTFHEPTNDPTRNLFPIPNTAILANSNLTQNPGY